MDQPPRRRRIDASAVIRRLKAMEQMRRARRRIVVGAMLAPTSCLFAVTRYSPDFAWAPQEVWIAAPLLLVSAALVLTGVLRFR